MMLVVLSASVLFALIAHVQINEANNEYGHRNTNKKCLNKC